VKAVAAVPSGQVVSYGQVAAYIGTPRAARQVGWAMGSIGGVADFPWWRVVNRNGVITINNTQISPPMQRQLLEAEGVEVDDSFQIDMKRFGYDLLTHAPSVGVEEQQRMRLIEDKYFD